MADPVSDVALRDEGDAWWGEVVQRMAAGAPRLTLEQCATLAALGAERARVPDADAEPAAA